MIAAPSLFNVRVKIGTSEQKCATEYRDYCKLTNLKCWGIYVCRKSGGAIAYTFLLIDWWNNDCSKDVKHRIAKATGTYEGFGKIWNNKEIRISTKTRLLSACVMSVLMYAAENWTLKKAGMNWVFEMKCLGSILNVKWKRKIKNYEIMKRTGTHINIIRGITQRKSNCFGQIDYAVWEMTGC